MPPVNELTDAVGSSPAKEMLARGGGSPCVPLLSPKTPMITGARDRASASR